MSLPVLDWRKVLKALAKKGFYPKRERGSHIVVQNKFGRGCVVPRHSELKPGTLLDILEKCGINRNEFLDLL